MYECYDNGDDPSYTFSMKATSNQSFVNRSSVSLCAVHCRDVAIQYHMNSARTVALTIRNIKTNLKQSVMFFTV